VAVCMSTRFHKKLLTDAQNDRLNVQSATLKC